MNKVKAEKKKKNGLFVGEIKRKRASKKFIRHRQVRKEVMADVGKLVGSY